MHVADEIETAALGRAEYLDAERAAAWMLEIGALLMRTESELLLKSRRVVPSRLLASGFKFEHPEWGEAARDLVARLKKL